MHSPRNKCRKRDSIPQSKGSPHKVEAFGTFPAQRWVFLICYLDDISWLMLKE